MTGRLATGLILAFLCSITAMAYGVICGKDDRVSMIPGKYPWRCIGRVEGYAAWGTGTLVGPRTVLTAAHVMLNNSTGQLDPKKGNRFLAGFYDGKFVFSSKVVGVELGSYRPDKAIEERQKDWALLTLEDSLGDEEHLGKVDVLPVDFTTIPKDVIGVGYSGDFKKGRTAGVDFTAKIRRTFSRFPALVYSDIDEEGGASGGPVLAATGNDEFKIVGIIVAGEGSDEKPQEYDEENHFTLVLTSSSFESPLRVNLSQTTKDHLTPSQSGP